MKSFQFLLLASLVAVGINQTSFANTTKINLNKATVKQLITLPHIGKKKAQDIIQLRTKLKSFKNLDELTQVKGISQKTVKKLNQDITV